MRPSYGKFIITNRPALNRLHLLQKDASQIGVNARKAVKLLDRMTSEKSDLDHEPVVIQGAEEQYTTWSEVEKHYKENSTAGDKNGDEQKGEESGKALLKKDQNSGDEKGNKGSLNQGGALSQALLDKLNFAPTAANGSPTVTPPLSPSASEPQSSKTSPEPHVADVAVADKSPVPPILKALLNPVVWYVHEKESEKDEVCFLTNSADTHHLARDFNIPTKTIHQLRSLIGVAMPQDPITDERNGTDHADLPPKGIFSYDDESEEEEVVFKPRGRGAVRATTSGRGNAQGSLRNRIGHHRSPRLSFSSTAPSGQQKPQIPVDEIDPDSFDRGSFSRGSMPLANTGNLGNHVQSQFNGHARGYAHHGGFAPAGPSRGMNYYRGPRGFDRGTVRGRGRLFVP